jgi:electron transfer flavoprotein alpha subunit
VQQTRPEVLLIGATASGLEVAARLAQRLGVGCVSECVHLGYENGELVLRRRTMGKFIAKERLRSRPAIVTIPPHRFEALQAQDGRTGRLQEIPMELPPSRTRLIESERRADGESPIEEASIVVSVGRGLRRSEDLALIARLARALGGAVAGSRPLTDDLRWLPANVKVGLSGRTVRPDLYLACGISGQVEHIVGMRDARVVVSINTDPNAPIMGEADYQVVGDLYDVLPALIEAR